jgi:hypothetical protein
VIASFRPAREGDSANTVLPHAATTRAGPIAEALVVSERPGGESALVKPPGDANKRCEGMTRYPIETMEVEAS